MNKLFSYFRPNDNNRTAPYVFFFLLSLIFFSPFFLDGKVFLAADVLYSYYPWKSLASPGFHPHNELISDPVLLYYPETYNRGLKQNGINLWNPAIFAGVPAHQSVSMGYPGRYYPLKILSHRLLPAPTATTLMLFFHVFMMACTMYIYLRQIGINRRASFFGSVAYMFNGCAMVWLEFESRVYVSAWLPLILWCLERLLMTKNPGFGFAAALSLGLLILSSHPQLTLYAVLLLTAYFIFLLLRAANGPEKRNAIFTILSGAVLTLAVGIMSAAVELMPLAELTSESNRLSRVLSFEDLFNTTARFPWRHFATLLFPDLFGNPAYGIDTIEKLPAQYYMNYAELSIYMGVPALFALTASLIGPMSGFGLFFAGTAALIVTMITGTFTYYPLFKFIPGMANIAPTRLIFLLMFSASVMAGIGMNQILKTEKSRTRALLAIWTIAALIVSAAVFIATIRGFKMPAPADRGPISGIYRPLLMLYGTFIIFTILLLSGKRKNLSNALFAVLTLLLSYDLISYGRTFNTIVDPSVIYRKTAAIDYLLSKPGPFRVVQDSGKALQVNTLASFGLEEIGGYASLYPARTHQLLSYIRFGLLSFGGFGFDRWVHFEDFSSKFFDLMNVRYVLTAPGTKLNPKKFLQVYDGDMAIYENIDVLPRVFAVHRARRFDDPRAMLRYMESDLFAMRDEVLLESLTAASEEEAPAYPPEIKIISYNNDKIHLSADLSAKGWVVLSDAYYPGWEATIDGLPSQILRANYCFRAVAMEAGRHDIVFSYRPQSVRNGMMLSAFGTAFCLTGIAVVAFRRNKRTVSRIDT